MEVITYIVKCKDGSFYTGVTKNLKRRITEHSIGQGANYFMRKNKLPIKVVFTKSFDSYDKAMKYERHIKRMSHNRKAMLIMTG